jgi:hypothetical protein
MRIWAQADADACAFPSCFWDGLCASCVHILHDFMFTRAHLCIRHVCVKWHKAEDGGCPSNEAGIGNLRGGREKRDRKETDFVQFYATTK